MRADPKIVTHTRIFIQYLAQIKHLIGQEAVLGLLTLSITPPHRCSTYSDQIQHCIETCQGFAAGVSYN